MQRFCFLQELSARVLHAVYTKIVTGYVSERGTLQGNGLDLFWVVAPNLNLSQMPCSEGCCREKEREGG